LFLLLQNQNFHSLPLFFFNLPERIQKKYSDLPGLVQLVDLNRGTAAMGMGLAGNKDRSKMSVFVAGIQPDSPAALDGRIQVGDELLEVCYSFLPNPKYIMFQISSVAACK
jgi:PDZ domain